MRTPYFSGKRAWRPLPLTFAIAVAFAPLLAQTQTLPTLPTAVRGTASVTSSSPGQMSVLQTTQNAVINWRSFSIGAGGQVTFVQPNAQSIALNRVTGSDPSVILGSLNANGRVFLVNPNGVLFGAGSSVNVGGLIASTLDIGDDDLMTGNFRFTRNSATRASVVNEGVLRAGPGGVIALVGSTVDNRGSIETPQGTAALAAGKTVTLDLQGDGLTQLRVTEADLKTLVNNRGALVADGGRVLLLGDSSDATGFVVNQSGIVRARSLTQGTGAVIIAGGAGDVSITGNVDTTGGAGLVGGEVIISGRNVGLLEAGRIDASGAAGGGRVRLVATGVAGQGGTVAVLPQAGISADATGAGSGGQVDLTGTFVRLHGSASVRGADSGGNGGLVKITADGVDTSGMHVDASAARGTAGTLNIDPSDVTIRQGSATTPPPDLNPFAGAGQSTVYTGDINNALDAGSNVTIATTNAGNGTGVITLGYIPVAGGGSSDATVIKRSTGTSPVTLRLDAAAGIIADMNSNGSLLIESSAGPLAVEMSVNQSSQGRGNGISLSGVASAAGGPKVSILTNGGSVSMFGADRSSPAVGNRNGVSLAGVTIDTRVGQSDAGSGGDVSIRGETMNDGGGLSAQGIAISDSAIRTSTGVLDLFGSVLSGATGGGVAITSSVLNTSSGGVSITGLGHQTSGFRLTQSQIVSGSGAIDLRGAFDGGGSGSAGVLLDNPSGSAGGGSFVASAGRVAIAGSTAGNGVGVQIDGDPLYSAVAGNVSGSAVTILAGNAAGSGVDALRVQGTVRATGVANVRPGGVDAAGNLVERNDLPLVLGNGQYGGLVIDSAELNRIVGSTVVLGSNLYGNVITVDGTGAASFLSNSNLTLQSGVGNIALQAPLGVAAGKTLALVTGGAITQSGNAAIAGDSVLVRADSASLQSASNSVGRLAAVIGTGTFSFLNNRGLTLGPVAATGITVVGTAPAALDANSLTTGAALVQTSAGDITLAGDIRSTALDLVTPGVFVNSAGSFITASNRWHLWAGDWVGETRGGLIGAGALPNVYGCTFGGNCVVSPVPTANSFIYARRPTLSIVVDDRTRHYGDANPAFTVSTAGLVNGDTASGILSGSPTSLATATSNAGTFAISGGALRAGAGYNVVSVSDGTLTVTPRPISLIADSASRVYGDLNPAFTGRVTGLASFDTLASVALSFSSAGPTANVGTYAIVPSLASPISVANYAVTSVTNGTMSVTPRSVSLVADSASRIYGDLNPGFTGSATGLASFDTPASVGLGFSSVGPAANVGAYGIVPSLGNATAAKNYAITTTNGALIINPATLAYVANSVTRSTFEPDPPLTGTVTGFKNADTLASATSGTLLWVSTAGDRAPPGSYAINGSGLSATNYVFVQREGNAAALTVTAPKLGDPAFAVLGVSISSGADNPVRTEQATYLYDRNQGRPLMCVPDVPLASPDYQGIGVADLLSIDWSRLRSRPNVATCFATAAANGCSDF